jgi:hypothetical protein
MKKLDLFMFSALTGFLSPSKRSILHAGWKGKRFRGWASARPEARQAVEIGDATRTNFAALSNFWCKKIGRDEIRYFGGGAGIADGIARI